MVSDTLWKYSKIIPNHTGWLTVSIQPAHSLYWEEYGNHAGEPVLFLHGGPGGGTTPDLARFFNPERYRIILFDQRGSGKSIPSAAESDASAALADNTTPHLIKDITLLLSQCFLILLFNGFTATIIHFKAHIHNIIILFVCFWRKLGQYTCLSLCY